MQSRAAKLRSAWDLVAVAMLGFLSALVLQMGCASWSPQCDFAKAIEQSDAVIIAEYRAYLDADPDLIPAERSAIEIHLAERARLILQELEGCDGTD
jgi:hypothetical protein